jgi:hypothetical protein
MIADKDYESKVHLITLEHVFVVEEAGRAKMDMEFLLQWPGVP